jgi:hypothetical protein
MHVRGKGARAMGHGDAAKPLNQDGRGTVVQSAGSGNRC